MVANRVVLIGVLRKNGDHGPEYHAGAGSVSCVQNWSCGDCALVYSRARCGSGGVFADFLAVGGRSRYFGANDGEL